MKTVEQENKDKLWQNVAMTFERAAWAIVEGRRAREKKAAALTDMLKLAYQSGVDRGYDLGWHVFGDGDGGDENRACAVEECEAPALPNSNFCNKHQRYDAGDFLDPPESN